MTSAITRFLRVNQLPLAENPCVSPDFCLDFERLAARVNAGRDVREYPLSRCETALGSLSLLEDVDGDHGYVLHAATPGAAERLHGGVALGSQRWLLPATFANLLLLKNLLQEHDPQSTVFPSASGGLGRASIGVGARFTTLHWPAVDWTMSALALSMTANQNSIPRELVYDVDAMLEGRLAGVPFPFIGCDVPEGHQGQSVEGMSHGAVLSKLKTGFHLRRIPWGFNADHQPVGGKYDAREAELVRGCLLASYITFDLSPELAITHRPADARAWCAEHVPQGVQEHVRRRAGELQLALDARELAELLSAVWPAMLKLQRRDRLYGEARKAAFTTPIGRAYFRELSIDELPGLTTPETLLSVLAVCEALDIELHYVAPAFGFQKNLPFDDSAELERRVAAAARVCQAFGCSIGFHSGSGKSADNYRLCGRLTQGRLEIKTSGRYTYEMGRALSESSDAEDQALWRDWHRFTRELALESAFAEAEQERSLARSFILRSLGEATRPSDVFRDRSSCAKVLAELVPDPAHMFWFEYNFLFVLAAGGRSDKAALGDHSAAGYRQRARFYAIREEARLRYAKHVANYLIMLAETTGQADAAVCQAARDRLHQLASYAALLADIAPHR
ncbi:MAG TPA: tagaturonate epimerase family protein [Polyangiaceae bacterium]